MLLKRNHQLRALGMIADPKLLDRSAAGRTGTNPHSAGRWTSASGSHSGAPPPSGAVSL